MSVALSTADAAAVCGQWSPQWRPDFNVESHYEEPLPGDLDLEGHLI